MNNGEIDKRIKQLFGDGIVKKAYSNNLDDYLDRYDLVYEEELNLAKLIIIVELVNGVILKINYDGIVKLN